MTDAAQEARWLLRAGRVEEAEQAFMRVLAESPFDLEALNIVALAAIQLGQFHRARELLNRAVSVSPDHAASHHHLGRVAELTGDLTQARASYERATRLSADLPAARLHLAALLERMGETHAALIQYTRVMADMQGQGRWLNAETTPPSLNTLVARAAQVVRSGRRELYFGLLEPLVAEFGRSGLVAGREDAAHPPERGATGIPGSAPEAHLPLLSRPARDNLLRPHPVSLDRRFRGPHE